MAMRSPPQPLRYLAWLIAFLLFGLFFSLYAFFAPPGITWSNDAADSAELATAVRSWGVAHPPGYPVYILFGKVFELIPAGDAAHRLALMSAFFGAVSVSLAYLLGRLFCQVAFNASKEQAARGPAQDSQAGLSALLPELGPALAALTLGFSPIFWGQAIVPEVYALNAFFVTGVGWLLLSWRLEGDSAKRARSKRPLLAAFLFGLGMGNHFTLAVAVLPLAMVALWRAFRSEGVRWAHMTGALALGLAVYVYLPIAAGQNPPVNWGDASTFSGFMWQVSGAPYQSYIFGVQSSIVDDRVVDWMKRIVDQFQGVGVALALVGAWRLWAFDRWLTGATLFSFFALSIYATFYLTHDSYVFLIPAVIIGALYIAAGSQHVLRQITSSGLDAPKKTASILGAVVAMVLLVPLLSVFRFSDEYSLRQDSAARAYAPHVVSQLPAGAIVLADSDQRLFSLWYHRYVTEPDATHIVVSRSLLQFEWYRRTLSARYPELEMQGLGGDFRGVLRAFVKKNIDAKPVLSVIDDPDLRELYAMRQEGPLFRLVPKS